MQRYHQWGCSVHDTHPMLGRRMHVLVRTPRLCLWLQGLGCRWGVSEGQNGTQTLDTPPGEGPLMKSQS